MERFALIDPLPSLVSFLSGRVNYGFRERGLRPRSR